MTRQRVLATLAAAIVAMAAMALPADAAEPKKFKATRPFVVDKDTGAVRMPTAAEVEQVVTTLEALGQRPDDNLVATAAPNGAVGLNLDGGFSGVPLTDGSGLRAGPSNKPAARNSSTPSRNAWTTSARSASAWAVET